MFQPPSYEKILTVYPENSKTSLSSLYPSYSTYHLYRYKEGQRFSLGTESVPVLFISGSQGSFKTIRSLATTIYAFSWNNLPFDYYSIDFNEEPTALNGQLIEYQTEFVNCAIKKIFEIYSHRKNPPKSIILIGHSMGSVIIFNLLSRWNFNQTQVKLVLSLASPIRQPVILPGRIMSQIYGRIHNYLNRVAKTPNYPLIVISLTGGNRDLLVSDILGDLTEDFPGLKSFWSITSSVQHVWASCDHRCILWCLQLMVVLNKGLLIQNDVRNSTLDDEVSLHLFRDLLITKPIRLNYNVAEPIRQVSEFVPDHRFWIDKTGSNGFILNHDVPKDGMLVKIGPFFKNSNQHILLLASDVSDSWIFLCDPIARNLKELCSKLLPISPKSAFFTWLPNPITKQPLSVALIYSYELMKFSSANQHIADKQSEYGLPGSNTYLVINTVTNHLRSRTVVGLDIIDNITDRIKLDFPIEAIKFWFYSTELISKSYSFQLNKLLSAQINEKNTSKSIFYRFYLPQEKYLLGSSLISPHLLINRHNCSNIEFIGIVTLNVPLRNYFYHLPIEADQTDFPLQVPFASINNLTNLFDKNNQPFVDFYFNPYCNYEIRIYYSYMHWFGQLLRLNWFHLTGLIGGHLLLSLVLIIWKIESMNYSTYSLFYLIFSSLNFNIPTFRNNSDNNKKPTITASLLLFEDVSYHIFYAIFYSVCFHLMNLPFSEWSELQRTGQVGFRLASDISIKLFQIVPLFQWIMGHLPALLINLSVSILIPTISCLLGGLFFYVSNVWIFIFKLNDSIYINWNKPSLIMFFISNIVILIMGWILSEAVAVLLLCVFLLLNVSLIFLILSSSLIHSINNSIVKYFEGKFLKARLKFAINFSHKYLCTIHSHGIKHFVQTT